MKKRRLAFDSLQPYRNRSYVAHLLDDRVFEAWNEDRDGACTLTLATTGCLDALDTMPAGSIRAMCNRHMGSSTETRGRTLAELQFLDDLIDDLMGSKS